MILKINALGLENSLRQKNDGMTFFGYIEEDNNFEVIDIIFLNFFRKIMKKMILILF